MKKEYSQKEKILITLILLTPFVLLIEGSTISKLIVFIYAGTLVYFMVEQDLFGLRLPPICTTHPEKKKQEPSTNPIRNAEQNVHNELKDKQLFNPFLFGEEPKKKRIIRRKKK